ncbi:MAG: hypothetical protein AAB263_05995 [Planctomycetota bacterium]
MGLPEDLAKLLKAEGYKTNETIQVAMNDLLDIVAEENEEMDDDSEDDGDEEVEGIDGLKADR